MLLGIRIDDVIDGRDKETREIQAHIPMVAVGLHILDKGGYPCW